MLYKRRKINVEAIQFVGTIEGFEKDIPKWLSDAISLHPLFDNSVHVNRTSNILIINRHISPHRNIVMPMDYIVRDEDGNLSAWKQDAFSQAFELINDRIQNDKKE